MIKKGLFIILVLFIVASTTVWAQDGGDNKKGIIITAPLNSATTIGGVYYLNDTTVLKPFVKISLDFDKDSDELANLEDTDSTHSIILGIAYDKILLESGPLSFYAGSAISFGFNSSETDIDGGSLIESTSFAISLDPRVGVQYLFTSAFGIYGNLEAGITYSSYTGKVTNNAGTVTTEDKGTSLGLNTAESALGVVFFF